MFRWHFKPKTAGEPNRDPIQGEFFATDAISDPGMALVREGVQNALDAGRPGAPVRVRIFLSEDAAAAPAWSGYREVATPFGSDTNERR